MSKVSDYHNLVVERKQCQKCDQSCIHNPALYADGKYDSDEIGPWTRWQGNLEAKVMVVGQDWGDTNYLKQQRAGKPSQSNE